VLNIYMKKFADIRLERENVINTYIKHKLLAILYVVIRLSRDNIFYIFVAYDFSRISDDVPAKCRYCKKACPSSNPRRRNHPRTRKPQPGIDYTVAVRSFSYRTIHILL